MQAGRFYDADPRRLSEEVDGYLGRHEPLRTEGRVAAIIVPHAGYYFSGNVAAKAYRALPKDKTFQRIFLIGPSHQTWLDGASVNK